jgi:polyisoprenoid-binding protein YceI
MNRSRNYKLLALLGVVTLLGWQSSVRADDYTIDRVHSAALFKVQHFQAGYTWGTFAGPTGTVSYDPADPTKASFDVSIDTKTIDTRNKMRDKDLQGPDFLDVAQFPTMTFKSTSIEKSGDTSMKVTGDLTIHGVTKSITVDMDMTGTGPGMKPGEVRTGFETTFTINRMDYGVTKDPAPAVGSDVTITVALEGIKQ